MSNISTNINNLKTQFFTTNYSIGLIDLLFENKKKT